MAGRVQWAGIAQPMRQAGVQWGGTRRDIAELYMAYNVWIQPPTDWDPETGQPTPPYWETRYRLVQTWRAPTRTPQPPLLVEVRDRNGVVQPQTVARWPYESPDDPQNPMLWDFRIQYEAQYSAGGVDIITNNVTNREGSAGGWVETTHDWPWNTIIRARLAYLNEAGQGQYSGWSGYVNLVSNIENG